MVIKVKIESKTLSKSKNKNNRILEITHYVWKFFLIISLLDINTESSNMYTSESV